MHKRVLYFQAKFLHEKKAEGDIITIKGFASTPDEDRQKDKVLATAFTETLPLYLKNPTVLLQHDGEKVIWKTTNADIRKNGLEVIADIMYNTDDCMTKIADGTLGAFSIWFMTQAYRFEDAQGHVMYVSDEGLMPGYEWDDLWGDGVIRIITKVDLVEISVVSTPANPYALFQVAKDFFEQESKELKSFASIMPAKKGAPNEYEEEKKEDEPATEDVKEEEKPNETPTDDPAKKEEETPTEEKPTEGEAKVEEEPPADGVKTEETPEGEAKTDVVEGDKKPEETPQGLSEEDVKAIVSKEVQAMIKTITDAFELKLKGATETIDTYNGLLDSLTEKHEVLEKAMLNIETVTPGWPRKGVEKSYNPARVITDEMVLRSIPR